ncbi:uncharacterized protein B0H18DRAFT_405977 [Fomitopsis serialis]|uniref:uncharacterized protein n=1 Tax=Fomitopsis serialis TaxID=139415 RepID=UPI002008C891|nr:uncharacterized protein B0H18DRAFT_405977 [Neoantrodia serialis]KAH9910838.1 hypothetical protein B0H18DRAFT_405977 [Neoantrodia serialis]
MKRDSSSDAMTFKLEGSSHKRLRLETDDATAAAQPSENEEFTRDQEFWYEDGNVILVAENVGFRVYRGFLAKRSEVLRDLFSVPQPLDGQRVCGCPIVHFSDNPIALRELLDVLLCGKRYMLENDAELDCLSYRIRLAQKYGIGDLLEESIWQLKKHYPTTFSEWTDVQRHYSPRAITAVNLARLTNTPSILPSASYVCCQLPNHDLLDGASLTAQLIYWIEAIC